MLKHVNSVDIVPPLARTLIEVEALGTATVGTVCGLDNGINQVEFTFTVQSSKYCILTSTEVFSSGCVQDELQSLRSVSHFINMSISSAQFSDYSFSTRVYESGFSFSHLRYSMRPNILYLV